MRKKPREGLFCLSGSEYGVAGDQADNEEYHEQKKVFAVPV